MWQTLLRKYATPLLLEPGPSRMLRAWLLLSHLLAISIVPFMSLPLWAGSISISVLLFSLWHSIRLHITLAHRDAVCGVEWFEAHDCQLQLSSGRETRARLMPQVFILPWLVIMHFRCDSGRIRHLVLLPDMLEQEVFRRLRVRLMIERDQAF